MVECEKNYWQSQISCISTFEIFLKQFSTCLIGTNTRIWIYLPGKFQSWWDLVDPMHPTCYGLDQTAWSSVKMLLTLHRKTVEENTCQHCNINWCPYMHGLPSPSLQRKGRDCFCFCFFFSNSLLDIFLLFVWFLLSWTLTVSPLHIPMLVMLINQSKKKFSILLNLPYKISAQK